MTERRRPTTRPAHGPACRPDVREGQVAADASGGRWFLACWPDAATRRALQRHQAAWAWPPGARPTPPAQLHLTLHFIGALPPGASTALRHALDTVDAATPVAWTLARVEVWRNGIAALVPERTPDAALELHTSLAAVLRRLGLAVEARPWLPHVTLARRAGGATAAGTDVPGPVHWTSTGFELVRSDHGYHRVGRWPPAASARRGS